MSGLAETPMATVQYIVRDDKEAEASFFCEKDGPNAILFDATYIETVPKLNGETVSELRAALAKKDIMKDTGLDLGWMNRHDEAHMLRVAAAVHQLGTRLGYSDDDVLVATLATMFHDIGYDFDNELLDRMRAGEIEMSQGVKDHHRRHPDVGAEIFLETMERLHREVEAVREEFPAWTTEQSDIADHSIRYHSNGSEYDPVRVRNLSKLARFADKLDNTNERSTERHVDGMTAIAMGQGIEEVRNAAQRGIEVVLGAKGTDAVSFDDIEGSMNEFDPYFFHKLAPCSVTDQCLTFDTETGDFHMCYLVDLSLVSDRFGIEYTAEHFLAHFDSAYGEGAMPRAAEVSSSIKSEVREADHRNDTLKTSFFFKGGETVVREYEPRFD